MKILYGWSIVKIFLVLVILSGTKYRATLKSGRYIRVPSTFKARRYPKCGSIRKVKNGFNREKQRYLCKDCIFKYTGTKNGYSKSVQHKDLRYNLEEVGFIRISDFLT